MPFTGRKKPSNARLFLLEMNSYQSKHPMLQGNRLISLNSEYKPVVIGEFDSFFIAGRVVGKVK